MILFIFEGAEREPNIYKTIERLYFPRNNDNIICCFGNNIYNLYSELLEYGEDGDIVALMKERLAETNDQTLENIRRTDISEIFLFFDYDFHHSQLPLDEINNRVLEMLQTFNDETNYGKLYINYPMIESIRYTKELPDISYCQYTVSREDCHDFKQLAHRFSYYTDFGHILFKRDEISPSKERYLTVKDNWRILIEMNTCKAHWLTSDKHEMPSSKPDINQLNIFLSQKRKFVEKFETVSVLNAFPIFIYEYFKRY